MAPPIFLPEEVSGFVPTADGKFVFGVSDSIALISRGRSRDRRRFPAFDIRPDGTIILPEYSGTARRIENQIGVFLSYASKLGSVPLQS
ncbi:MAG TPA: hypothetical protein VKZ53_13165 [Candidatus Angelobacter sp.]|nr:hypothetical protein [Candidatus Angelobacter sp.]